MQPFRTVVIELEQCGVEVLVSVYDCPDTAAYGEAISTTDCQGLFTLIDWPLLEGIFALSEAERVPYINIYKRLRACPANIVSVLGITKLGAKMRLALRVVAKKAPLVVVRTQSTRCASFRSFGITKLCFPRLNWRFF